MPSDKTLSKGVTNEQFQAFEEACRLAGLSTNDAKEAAYKLFCEKHGVEWPASFTHGGDRKSAKTYIVDFPTKGWVQDNVANPGSGQIKMGPARATVEVELEDGNILNVMLVAAGPGAKRNIYNTEVEDALILTPENEVVRHLNPTQIQLR